MTPDSDSLVDYLKSQGVRSDFEARKHIAEKYGIPHYTGTAQENIQLLGILHESAFGRLWDEIKAFLHL